MEKNRSMNAAKKVHFIVCQIKTYSLNTKGNVDGFVL